MIIFVASFATGLGIVPWQQGELFGLEITPLFVLYTIKNTNFNVKNLKICII
jgi:hypothetical protein